MDILPILVAMLVAVAAVIVAGVFYSKAKVSEQEAANWKRSMAAQVDQQVAKAVADSKDALSAAERKSLELEGDNARLRSQLEAQQQSASRDLELAVGKARSELAGQVADAKEECQKLRDRISEFERDAMRSETDTQLKLAEKDRQIDIAKSDAEHEASRLRSEIENLKSSAHQAQEIAVNHAVSEANRKLTESEQKCLAISNANLDLEKQVADAKATLDFTVKEKEKEIERIRNDKAKLSVKMLGESLEQHCEVAFNQVRSYAFPNATFSKDNDASQGTKGDYIYRECDSDGVELLSIMFEMKNEAETSVHTKKNEDHFKKLDKDRKEKGCEYAVLVSLLEPESELYNIGIVDVSHNYPKMFVIRPQFFVPFIGILRNAALSSLKAKQELERMRQEDVDLATFEDKLDDLKGIAVNFYGKTHDKCESAKKSIGQAITKMESIQRDIDLIDSNSSKAKEKTEDLTIRRLTWGNKAMKAAFESVKQKLTAQS